MLFFLTYPLRGGGPGRALCTPTFHGLSDGPFRRIPFRLRHGRRTYKDVLLFGDEWQLLSTAKELLRQPTQKKRQQFWVVYSKRAKASFPIISPSTAALILKSFHVHHIDTGIYVAAATVLPPKIEAADGKALLTLCEIFSSRLQQQQQQQQQQHQLIFKAIAQQIPHVIHEISCKEIVRLLRALNSISFFDLMLCRLFSRKLETYSSSLDHGASSYWETDCLRVLLLVLLRVLLEWTADIAAAASGFAQQNFRSLRLYEALQKQAMQQKSSFELSSLYELLNGFYQNAVVCDQLLECFSPHLLKFKDQFNSKQRRVIGQMISDSELPLPKELRKEFRREVAE